MRAWCGAHGVGTSRLVRVRFTSGRAAALPVLDYVVRATAAPLPGPDMASGRRPSGELAE